MITKFKIPYDPTAQELIQEAYENQVGFWGEGDAAKCPLCLNMLVDVRREEKDSHDFIGHEPDCWFKRAQVWLLSNGAQVPGFE